MQEELDRITEEVSRELRRLLGDGGAIPFSVEFTWEIGRYKIEFKRVSGNENPIISLPQEVLDYLQEVINRLDELWNEKGEELYWCSDLSGNEQVTSIDINGMNHEIEIQDIEARIERHNEKMQEAVDNEEFEIAAYHRDRIRKINQTRP